ncbi:Uncharacterized protein HZ326_11751 [Fusarium oxysporum f. sp. albedinis]|nr:Uncharacterized protein HZ326_11751 [Fusarium oxysporum f. sp. albedinis]
MDFSRLSVADALRPQIWKRIAFLQNNGGSETLVLALPPYITIYSSISAAGKDASFNVQCLENISVFLL